VIGTAAANGEAQASVTAYEHLRRHVLTGTPGDAHALVRVVRAGIAAWLEPDPTGAPTPAADGPAGDRSRAAAGLSGSVVHVLATMAMAHGRQRSGR
jgi:hypothetical protein